MMIPNLLRIFQKCLEMHKNPCDSRFASCLIAFQPSKHVNWSFVYQIIYLLQIEFWKHRSITHIERNDDRWCHPINAHASSPKSTNSIIKNNHNKHLVVLLQLRPWPIVYGFLLDFLNGTSHWAHTQSTQRILEIVKRYSTDSNSSFQLKIPNANRKERNT